MAIIYFFGVRIMKSSGNTILITGGATGIGYALAESFLKSGNNVIICGRRKERLLEAQKHYPELKIFQCDVSKDKDRKALLEYIKSNCNDMNILINNAGIQRDIDLTKGEQDLITGENEIAINLEAPIHLSAIFVPFLSTKKDPYIINVSSGLGFVPSARMPVYSATKAAVHAFSMSLRQQLLKTSIKVIEIVPPGVDSELNKEGRAKRGGYTAGLSSKDFVSAIIDKIYKDELEIGYGFTEPFKTASREELDKRFQMMNSR